MRWVSPALMVKIVARPAAVLTVVCMPMTSTTRPIWVRAVSSDGWLTPMNV
ncbi:MAG: hypothetical protein VYC01_02680 [Nitrospinota bacterium]|nr:hypothetical protein [Nitrospinota bacterium]